MVNLEAEENVEKGGNDNEENGDGDKEGVVFEVSDTCTDINEGSSGVRFLRKESDESVASFVLVALVLI